MDDTTILSVIRLKDGLKALDNKEALKLLRTCPKLCIQCKRQLSHKKFTINNNGMIFAMSYCSHCDKEYAIHSIVNVSSKSYNWTLLGSQSVSNIDS